MTCGKSRPTAPPSGASAVVAPRPTSRTPKPSPARRWPTRPCLRPGSTPPPARPGRRSPCCATGASLVLQRVRLLTEAEAVLVTLPVAVRDALPATSRVLPQLTALADGHVRPAALAPADQLKLDRLATSLLDITTLTKRIKELDQRIPALLAELGSTLTDLHGVGVVPAVDLLAEIGDPHRFTSEAQFARGVE